MATHWVKEQVHRNELAVAIERLARWINENREAALGIGATLCVALFLGIYSAVKMQDVKTQAWEKVAIAQNYAFAGQQKTAIEQLQVVGEQYPRTKAAGFGELFQGDLLFQSGDYKGAIAFYQKALDRKDPGILPFAQSGMAFSQEGAGQAAAAAQAANDFLSQNPDHFLAPQVHAVLARALKAQNRDEEAKATLEKIALLYPETYWAAWAQKTLHPEPPKLLAAPQPAAKALGSAPAPAPSPVPKPVAP